MRVPFRDLPDPVRAHLAELTRGAHSQEVFVVPTEGGAGKIVAVVFGILIVLATLTISILAPIWEGPAAGFVAGGILLGLLLTLFKLARWRSYRRSVVRPAIVATPILIAKCGLENEPVELHYHKDLTTPNIVHQHYNGAYTHTSFGLVYSTGWLNFTIHNRSSADGFLNYLRGTGDILAAWAASAEVEAKITQFDWIGASTRATATPWGRPRFISTALGKVLVSTAAAAILTALAWAGNLVSNEISDWSQARRRDSSSSYQSYLQRPPLGWWKAEAMKLEDDAAHREAVHARTAGALRGYLQSHAGGRHVEEAREEIRALYRKAEEAYLAKSAKAVPQANEGMKALLAHLREQSSPVVNICFAPAEGIDGKEAEAQVFEMTQSTKIFPVGPSFSAEANRAREDRIIGIMGASFRQVLTDDLFALTSSSLADPGPRFLVRYKVVGSGTYYTWNREKNLPLAQRSCYVGIQVDFVFSLQVPGSAHPVDSDPAKGFAFTMSASPAPNFTVMGSDPSATDVYTRMAETAFQEFEVNLCNAYGLELVMPKDWGAISGVDPDRDPTPGTPGFKIPDFKMPEFKKPVISDDLQLYLIVNNVVIEGMKQSPKPTIDDLVERAKASAQRSGVTIKDEAKLRRDIETQWRFKNLPTLKEPEKKEDE